MNKHRSLKTLWIWRTVSQQVDYHAGDGDRTGSMNKALVPEGKEGARGQLSY